MLILALLFLVGNVPGSRQPQLAAAHGQVAMTFGAGASIYFAASRDQGRTFDAPVKVAETGALMLGRHRGPRVAITNRAVVISAIITEPGAKDGGNLMSWRSADRGKTWTRGGVINDVPGAAREGLHAMASGPDGKLFAAWLDLRSKGTTLAVSSSTDDGVTWSPNQIAYTSPDGTICQCCHPSLSVDDSGRVWLMWRNALDGSRDLYISSSTDGKHFAEAQKLGEGTWKLNACPMDGGGLAVRNGQVTSVWRRDGSIFLAEPGKSEHVMGTGKDAAIAVGKAGPYLAWTQGGGLQLKAPGSEAPQKLADEGAYVTLVALDGAVLAAWETAHGIDTKRWD